jgi:hypothetical protein
VVVLEALCILLAVLLAEHYFHLDIKCKKKL